MQKTICHRAIFVSDLHLGSAYAQPAKIEQFLKSVDCDYLYLVGDIIDFWALDSSVRYFDQATLNVIRALLTKTKNGTTVVYLPGNHDEIVRDMLLYIQDTYAWFGGITVLNETTHITSSNLHFKVLHGDQFDSEVSNMRWLNRLGDMGYSLLLSLNKPLQRMRKFLGYRSHWSLSQAIKRQVKEAALFTNTYHQLVIDHGRKYDYQGIICGHIHSPEVLVQPDGFVYGNCGDWVESFSYLYEDAQGHIQLGYFK
ncbi:MAG: UDP-2,3-diacylglucosamine diphosphatase [Sulfurovum sp.]|nr:MAG: UDP-2,3-diacylglucosamine diphosphatase [Sulfurovum sp.]